MGKINLPSNFIIRQEDNLDLKKELENQFNRIKNDLEHISTNYVDETELMTYYKNYSIYFRKVANLIKTYFETNRLFDKCEELVFYIKQQQRYIYAADELACYFEEFKTNLRPPIDLDSALALRVGENFGCSDKIDYTEINRLIKIFLQKENLAGIEHFVENGILNIKTKQFELKLTLCGDINNPNWKLFDINRQNKVPFLMELPSNIKHLIPLIKIYEGKIEAKEIYNLINDDKALNGLLKGNVYDFELDFILNLQVKVNSKGITAVVTKNTKKIFFKNQILKKYENEIKDSLRKINSEIDFTFKDKIRINQHRFTNLVDLNEYLFTEKTKTCFYNLFESFEPRFDFRKEEFGKNVTLFLKGNFVIFKLEKIDFNETHLLESLVYITVFIDKYTEENVLKKEIYIKNTDSPKFTTFSCSKNGITAFNLKDLIESSIIFLNNFYELAIQNYEIEIYNQEMRISDLQIVVTQNKGEFLINERYKICSLNQIFTFLKFLDLKKSFGETENCFIKDIPFKIFFNSGISVKSENSALEKYIRLRNPHSAFNLLYTFISTNMFPTYTTQDFVIFEFTTFLDQNFYFKVEESQLLLAKTDFIADNLSLPPYNSTYYACDPKNSVFFNEFKSFYFKDRFVRLAFELKNEFDVRINNLEIIVKHKKTYVFVLSKDVFSVNFVSEEVPKTVVEDMVKAFYKNENYVEVYRDIIRIY